MHLYVRCCRSTRVRKMMKYTKMRLRVREEKLWKRMWKWSIRIKVRSFTRTCTVHTTTSRVLRRSRIVCTLYDAIYGRYVYSYILYVQSSIVLVLHNSQVIVRSTYPIPIKVANVVGYLVNVCACVYRTVFSGNANVKVECLLDDVDQVKLPAVKKLTAANLWARFVIRYSLIVNRYTLACLVLPFTSAVLRSYLQADHA